MKKNILTAKSLAALLVFGIVSNGCGGDGGALTQEKVTEMLEGKKDNDGKVTGGYAKKSELDAKADANSVLNEAAVKEKALDVLTAEIGKKATNQGAFKDFSTVSDKYTLDYKKLTDMLNGEEESNGVRTTYKDKFKGYLGITPGGGFTMEHADAEGELKKMTKAEYLSMKTAGADFAAVKGVTDSINTTIDTRIDSKVTDLEPIRNLEILLLSGIAKSSDHAIWMAIYTDITRAARLAFATPATDQVIKAANGEWRITGGNAFAVAANDARTIYPSGIAGDVVAAAAATEANAGFAKIVPTTILDGTFKVTPAAETGSVKAGPKDMTIKYDKTAKKFTISEGACTVVA